MDSVIVVVVVVVEGMVAVSVNDRVVEAWMGVTVDVSVSVDVDT